MQNWNHWNWQEIIHFALLNSGATAWWIHFQYVTLLPRPDRFVEWIVGIFVGLSLITVNTVKVYYLLKNKTHHDGKGKR